MARVMTTAIYHEAESYCNTAIHGEKRKLSNKGFPVLSEIIFRNVGGVITIESYRQRPDTVKIMTLDIPIEICYVSLQTCISRNIYHSVRCVRRCRTGWRAYQTIVKPRK